MVKISAAIGICALTLSAALGGRPLLAVGIELRNVADDVPASKINFDPVQSSIQYNLAKQYLKIDHAGEPIEAIRIYTNNGSQAGLIGQGGRVPLYWSAFPAAQSPGALAFDAGSEPSWKGVLDSGDPGFQPGAVQVAIPASGSGVSYVYFGSKVPADVSAPGDYQSNFVLEIVKAAPDGKAPVILHSACSEAFAGQPILMGASVDEESDLKSAFFHYRLKGQQGYTTLPMQIRAESSGRWKIVASMPAEPGAVEYYYEVSDGVHSATIGSAESPKMMQVVNEFTALSVNVSPAGGRGVGDSICGEASRIPQLVFQPGALERQTLIKIKRLNAPALPKMNLQSAVAAYEFTPHGLTFKRPVDVRLPYADEDGDGRVDGTGLDARELKLFWHDGSAWRNLGGRVDLAARAVTGQVSHFSTYALFAANDPTDDEVRPRENIISPNGDGINDFAQFGISGSFEIRILDVRGRLVRKLENVSIWDGRDDDGSAVESGAYVYQVKAARGTVSGMIAVGK